MENPKKISYTKINNVRTILLLFVNKSINHKASDIKLNSTPLMEISQQYESHCIKIQNPIIRGLSTENIQYKLCNSYEQSNLNERFEEEKEICNKRRKSLKEAMISLEESIEKQQNQLDSCTPNMELSKIGLQSIRDIFSQVKGSDNISNSLHKRVSSIDCLLDFMNEEDSIRAFNKSIKHNQIKFHRKSTEAQ